MIITPPLIFNSVLSFIWITYAWETYLSYRQYSLFKQTTDVPPKLKDVMSQETFSKARLYQIEKKRFAFISTLYQQLETTLILVFGILPLVWHLSERFITRFMGLNADYEIVQSIVFMMIQMLYSLVSGLPWSLYSTFVIEEKFGFNNQTLGFFIKDTLRKTALSVALALPITSLLIYIIKQGGDYFYVYVWLFLVVVTLIFISIYNDYIAPLFDKFTTLPAGELRTAIEDLAQSIDFPLTNIFIVDGSKRSSHSNAYFFGFYKNKRIVLFDTLLAEKIPLDGEKEAKADEPTEEIVTKEAEANEVNEAKEAEANEVNEVKKTEEVEKKAKMGCTNEEVLAVLSHELGHWKLNHIVKNLIITQINLFFIFMMFSLFMNETRLYEAFGFYDSKPTIMGLTIILTFIFAPYNEVFSFCMTYMTRMHEFEADAFACTLKKASLLQQALIKLNQDNLGFPIADWLYSAYHYSHPPLLERLAAIQKHA